MPIAPDNLDLQVPIGADSSRYIGFRSAAIGTYRDLSGAIGTKNEFPSNPNQIGKKMVRLSISGSSRRKESHFCISRINYSSPTTGYGLIRNLKSKSKNLKIPSKRTRQNLKQLPSLALVKAVISILAFRCTTTVLVPLEEALADGQPQCESRSVKSKPAIHFLTEP